MRISILLVGLLSVFGVACGDDSGALPDATVVFDSAPPDAVGCTQTMCGTACVNTAIDELHCGGCNMPCATGAQACLNSVCECPADGFVPANPMAFMGFDQILSDTPVAGAQTALLPYQGGGALNVLTIAYDSTVVTGVDIDISALAVGAYPLFGVGYNINIGNQTAQATYIATEGIINFSIACPTGLAGTVTDLVLSEVDLNTMTIVSNGCGATAATVTFAVGDSCIDGDAGVSDGGVFDAGIDAS